MSTMRDIVALVAERHRISVAELRGPGRQRYAAHARHEAIWLMRQEGRWSLGQIGQFFDRDHTTIRTSCLAFEARRRGEPHPWRAKMAARLSTPAPQLVHSEKHACGQGRLSQSHSESKQGKVSA